MEQLQLTLTLSSSHFSSVSSNYEAAKEVVASSKNQLLMMMNDQDHCNMMMVKKKRTYDMAFQEVNSTDAAVPQTLSLFAWKPDGGDDRDGESLENKHSIHFNNNDEDENGIVGWPPIKSWRKRLWHLGSATNYVRVENGGGNGRRGGRYNSMYVKVKMEGVGIARKVDLSLHHSFQTLTDTLIALFGKCQDNVQAYKLAYQDKEGDWLLAGDVPWGTFVRSVQRLKLVKNDTTERIANRREC